ncbi:hypothetical protein IR145_12875 [Streptococcus danieliae]|uniref:Uncharacterized protein n=2 Tax=Streptococcus acidominimus TaxID=1326 RepID=A0A4Y9FM97_STRAI|nr:hypothetical protein [Streptococcus acidominimus]MBF0839742.1 hypothetical protein [Streptococcus acidominimus]MBF0848343.1 hypothetical protein [Streptococcus danieliae]TFU30347.1 hypothetical protein E4U01_06610 [Streptococcus acidominimus]
MINKIIDNSVDDSVTEQRISWGECPVDQYEAEACFSENSTFELGTVCLNGQKHKIDIRFPFSHCYRIIDRELAIVLYQVPKLPIVGIEYPLYKVKNSLLIQQIVNEAGGVLEKEELEHYQVLAVNIVIDVVLYKNEHFSIEGLGGTNGKMDK